MLSAVGRQFEDWTSAYRLFSKERIDCAALFTPAREAVIERLKPNEPLAVMMDDTLEAFAAGKAHVFDVKTISAVWSCARWHIVRAREPSCFIARPCVPDLHRRGIASGVSVAGIYLALGDRVELPRRKDRPWCGESSNPQATLRGECPVTDCGIVRVFAARWERSWRRTKHPAAAKMAAQRYSTQDMISLFRTQLWRIGLKKNLTHFASDTSIDANAFFLQDSLPSAVMFAQK
jgi:hypothetical protein